MAEAQSAEDLFDEAFAAAGVAMDTAGEPPKDPPKDETPPADPPKDPPKDETPPADPPKDPPKDETPPADPPKDPPKDETPPQETAEEKAAREAIEASIAPYEPTAEEKAAMEQFKKDFPQEHAAVEARLKGVDKDINARVYKAVTDAVARVRAEFAPVVKETADAAVERHFAAIRDAHADADEAFVNKVGAWIKTQPALLQPGLQSAFDKGTAQQVIDLFTYYKNATKTAAPPTPPATPKPPADADDLTPVKTRRVDMSPAGSKDPNDFDGAFEEAAALYAAKK